MSSIYAKRFGSGAPVILIHGFCENLAVWNPLVNKLALTNEVIIIDLPGFGKSPLPKRSFSIESISELVHNWIIEENLNNVTVLGHSLGGYVALALANNYPENLNAIGLIHSTSFADDKAKIESRNKTIDFVTKRGVKVFADSFVRQLFYAQNRKHLAPEIETVTAIAASTNKDTLVKYVKAMRDRPDRSQVLASFQKPILFISGSQDALVPIEKSRLQYELISNPFISELSEVGHMGMIEATEKCYLAIAQFLAQIEQHAKDSSTSGRLPDRDLKKNLGCG